MARPISAKNRYIREEMRRVAKEQEEKKGTIPHILAVVRAKRAKLAYQVQS